MCTTFYFYFCLHYSMLPIKRLVSMSHYTVGSPLPIPPSSLPLPPGTHYVPCICLLSLFILFCFYTPCMSDIMQYLSVSI